MDITIVIYIILLMIGLGIAISYLGTDMLIALGVILGGVSITFLLLFFRRILSRNQINEHIRQKKENRRNTVITAKVTKVNNMMWAKKKLYDSDLECECSNENGEKYVFKIQGVKAKFKVREGDNVNVLVEEGNWTNYQILLADIVE